MKTLNPYISFSGKCKEALEFYKNCFDGEIVMMETFNDCPDEIPDEIKNNIMHAEFKAEAIYFMATDGMSNDETTIGNNITLSIQFTSEEEQTQIFALLSRGGVVSMPLENTFWGARFGMLTDQFGINWMLNCMNEQ